MPQCGAFLGRALADTKERDGIHVTNIQQNFDCGNVVTAWIYRSRFNIALLSINFSSVITRNSLKNVTYRPLCKGIETLLRYCGTWLTDFWSSLVSQTNYILHMFKAKQHLFSILHRDIHTPKTHRYPVKTVIYMVKFYRWLRVQDQSPSSTWDVSYSIKLFISVDCKRVSGLWFKRYHRFNL